MFAKSIVYLILLVKLSQNFHWSYKGESRSLGYYSGMFATLRISWSMASVCSHFVKPMPTHKFSSTRSRPMRSFGSLFLCRNEGSSPTQFFGVHLLVFVLWRISKLGLTSEGDQWISSEVDISPAVVNAFLRELICRIIKVVKYYLEITYKKYIRGQKKV